MNINDLLKIAIERKASDLHLKVGSHPVIRVDGQLHTLQDLKRLMQEDTIAMAFSITRTLSVSQPATCCAAPQRLKPSSISNCPHCTHATTGDN